MEKTRPHREGEDLTVIKRVLQGGSPSFRNFRDLYFMPDEEDAAGKQGDANEDQKGKGPKGKRARDQGRESGGTSPPEMEEEDDRATAEPRQENLTSPSQELIVKKSKTE